MNETLPDSFTPREYYEQYKKQREEKQREEEEKKRREEEEVQKVAAVNEDDLFDPLSYLCQYSVCSQNGSMGPLSVPILEFDS